jgi:hypothetical protein
MLFTHSTNKDISKMKSKRIKSKLIIFGLIWLLLFAGRCNNNEVQFKIDQYPCEECKEEYSKICIEIRLFDEDDRRRYIAGKESDSTDLGYYYPNRAWEDFVPQAPSKDSIRRMESQIAGQIINLGGNAKAFSEVQSESQFIDLDAKLKMLKNQGFDAYVLINKEFIVMRFYEEVSISGPGSFSVELNKDEIDSIINNSKEEDRHTYHWNPEYKVEVSLYDINTRKKTRSLTAINPKYDQSQYNIWYLSQIPEYLHDEGLILEND